MTVYAWPNWQVERFEMRVQPNVRVFNGAYTPVTQVVDLLGEVFVASIDLAPHTDLLIGAAREAFFDRLKGPTHQIALWNLRRPAPQGTMRGSPVLASSVAQLANTATITTTAGATLKAGDHIGISGQLVRVMADATANGSGALAIEFMPRARLAWSSGAAVTWNKPTANFMLKSDSVPVTYRPGMFDGSSFDLIEVP